MFGVSICFWFWLYFVPLSQINLKQNILTRTSKDSNATAHSVDSDTFY